MTEPLPGLTPDEEKEIARTEAALLALNWIETTHGNDFGHDHHCPSSARQRIGMVWVDDPGDPKDCTCGWSAFRQAYDRYNTEWPA